MINRAAILGTGSWGTALATLLAQSLDEVCLIGRNAKTADEINQHHTNHHYLPELTLPENITACTDIAAAATYPLVLFVVPTSATEATAKQLAEINLPKETILVSCSKGIAAHTGERMSQLIHAHLPENPLAVLSGPNHAEEVCKSLATCAVIGADDHALAEQLQKIFTTNAFRCYTSDDVAGIELGAAMKNVFGIAAGIADGLGLGDNAIAALVTRGLAEMTRLGTRLGGKMETFIGLSGVGDLMATCYSPHSRNNRVGKALGKGGKLEDIVANLGMVAEGVPNTKSIHEAGLKADIRTPLTDAVYQILYENKPASEALEELLTRDTRPEAD
ncbi:NAD(P)-dependent glycerol-3-phosphate dehydrogenase [Verrucomicrobiaceae bacterium 5K15]|uniref:Glycerol-3-phosphate dehydrogenase [NAD(P)+] n=1 Tax=Oceaniferula flava TaxID=2800421 RepID=A0AAE2S909_9BACT|nr:NAD(P)H-dependent glycerol-3-phosphate dehydrogenase [Oceaniferula flavus]MBK1853355.1 NAD(P)-dependent glycerol-3-phosphate dehydrogenase [Oceaniferula flavus]MBM1134660.1 NAD(P)-dependent glycerol-3-phosphate dehydrogenase [Oceaniferula flavus]